MRQALCWLAERRQLGAHSPERTSETLQRTQAAVTTEGAGKGTVKKLEGPEGFPGKGPFSRVWEEVGASWAHKEGDRKLRPLEQALGLKSWGGGQLTGKMAPGCRAGPG